MKILNWLFKKNEPETLKFKKGQHVMCNNGEYHNMAVIYHGVIVKWIGFKPAYLHDSGVNWFRVNIKQIGIKDVPETFMADYEEAKAKFKRMYEANFDRVGQPGFSFEAMAKISSIINE